MGGHYASSGVDSSHSGHTDIHEHDVGFGFRNRVKGFFARVGLADDHDVVCRVEQERIAFAV